MNRSSTLRASLVTACTLLLLSTSLADAAQIRQPQQPQTPITTPDPGNNKPAVDFDLDIWTQLAAKDPYAGKLQCMKWTNPSAGYPQLWFFNHSGKTIPAGSILTWTLPGGKTVTITIKLPIYPGSGMAISSPPGMLEKPDFACTVKGDWSPARVL